jgi:CBS domain-containing protein
MPPALRPGLMPIAVAGHAPWNPSARRTLGLHSTAAASQEDMPTEIVEDPEQRELPDMAAKKIRDVMTEGVELIDPEATLSDAAVRMAETDLGILPVGEDDRLIGVVTDRDLVVRGLAQGSDPNETRIREVMTDRVLYCFDDQEPSKAADDMAKQQIRRMPVVNRDKRLIGMVSLADIARKHDAKKAGNTLKEVVVPGDSARH